MHGRRKSQYISSMNNISDGKMKLVIKIRYCKPRQIFIRIREESSYPVK
jgi:hypothetical protein